MKTIKGMLWNVLRIAVAGYAIAFVLGFWLTVFDVLSQDKSEETENEAK